MIKDPLLREALDILQEEAAEVIKEASKVKRSGPDYKPFGGDTSNWEHLQHEVWDFMILALYLKLKLEVPDDYLETKLAKLDKWSDLFPGGLDARPDTQG